MSKNGWEFIAQALEKDGLTFTHACVRIDDRFGQVPVAELRGWLEQMTFLDDPSDPAWQDNPDPTPPGRAFDFAIWDSEGWVWYPSSRDGVAYLGRRPALPTAWLRDYRNSIDEPGLVELERDIVGEIDQIVAGGPEVTEIPAEYRWNSDDVEFDLDRWASYEVAREAMRDRIATLSAEVARIENEIVDVGVEMGQLDSTDMDAIQTAIAKYRPGLAREEAIAELLATARRLAPAFEDFVNPSKSDLEVLEAATAMARAMTNWGPFVDNPMHPALDVPDVDLSRREGLADRIVADIDGWTRMLPGAKIPLSIRVEGLPDHVAERLEVLKGLENKGLPVKIELIDGSDQD